MTYIYLDNKSYLQQTQNIFKSKSENVVVDFFKSGRDHTVKLLNNLSIRMHQSSTVACSVFLIANTIFFALTSFVANKITGANIEANRTFTVLAIDSALVGAAVLGFNVLISKLTHYPLSNIALTAITTTCVALRIIWNLSSEDELISNLSTEADEAAKEKATKDTQAAKDLQASKDAAAKADLAKKELEDAQKDPLKAKIVSDLASKAAQAEKEVVITKARAFQSEHEARVATKKAGALAAKVQLAKDTEAAVEKSVSKSGENSTKEEPSVANPSATKKPEPNDQQKAVLTAADESAAAAALAAQQSTVVKQVAKDDLAGAKEVVGEIADIAKAADQDVLKKTEKALKANEIASNSTVAAIKAEQQAEIINSEAGLAKDIVDSALTIKDNLSKKAASAKVLKDDADKQAAAAAKNLATAQAIKDDAEKIAAAAIVVGKDTAGAAKLAKVQATIDFNKAATDIANAEKAENEALISVKADEVAKAAQMAAENAAGMGDDDTVTINLTNKKPKAAVVE